MAPALCLRGALISAVFTLLLSAVCSQEVEEEEDEDVAAPRRDDTFGKFGPTRHSECKHNKKPRGADCSVSPHFVVFELHLLPQFNPIPAPPREI